MPSSTVIWPFRNRIGSVVHYTVLEPVLQHVLRKWNVGSLFGFRLRTEIFRNRERQEFDLLGTGVLPEGKCLGNAAHSISRRPRQHVSIVSHGGRRLVKHGCQRHSTSHRHRRTAMPIPVWLAGSCRRNQFPTVCPYSAIILRCQSAIGTKFIMSSPLLNQAISNN